MTAIAEVVEAADRALAAHAAPDPGPDRFGELVADAARLFVLEATYEGYLMHYGRPRAFTGMDADLRLLAGDALYALGLSRLAESGDIEAVTELADLISLSARAHAEGRAGLVEQLWLASAERLAGRAAAGAQDSWRAAHGRAPA